MPLAVDLDERALALGRAARGRGAPRSGRAGRSSAGSSRASCRTGWRWAPPKAALELVQDDHALLSRSQPRDRYLLARPLLTASCQEGVAERVSMRRADRLFQIIQILRRGAPGRYRRCARGGARGLGAHGLPRRRRADRRSACRSRVRPASATCCATASICRPDVHRGRARRVADRHPHRQELGRSRARPCRGGRAGQGRGRRAGAPARSDREPRSCRAAERPAAGDRDRHGRRCAAASARSARSTSTIST